MSTLVTTTVRSANGTTDITVGSGNTSGGGLVVFANGSGLVLQANSSANVVTINTTSMSVTGNTLIGGTAINPNQGMKNRIINGDMRIDQRNAGAAVSVSGNDIYTVDRWKGWGNGGGVFSVQQSSTAPNNFNNSVVLTVTTADSSVAAGDFYAYAQDIEGYNVADLDFGLSSAKSITVSFWVRSNLTGTYGGAIYSVNANRSYVYGYTINSANTWEYKTITIPGDTSGTWLKTNGNGLRIYFDLGSGSTYQNATGSWVASQKFSTSGNANWIGTLSNNLYITGVQLEVGSVATAFERRLYGTELVLCQRYYLKVLGPMSIFGYWDGTNYGYGGYNFPVTMRTAPTSLSYSSLSHFTVNNSGVGNPTASAISLDSTSNPYVGSIYFAVSSGGSSGGKATKLFTGTSTAYIEFLGSEL